MGSSIFYTGGMEFVTLPCEGLIEVLDEVLGYDTRYGKWTTLRGSDWQFYIDLELTSDLTIIHDGSEKSDAMDDMLNFVIRVLQHEANLNGWRFDGLKGAMFGSGDYTTTVKMETPFNAVEQVLDHDLLMATHTCPNCGHTF